MQPAIALLLAVATLLAACSRSEPEQIVKSYLEAKHWEDRLAYVKYPEITKPMMARYYAQLASAFPQPYVEIQKPEKSDVPIGDWTQVMVILARGKNSLGMTVTEATFYDIQRTTTGYKIDWESSIPYNPMSAAEFKSNKSLTPVRFRAVAKLSDIYPFGRDSFRQQHWSVSFMLRQSYTKGSIESLGIGFIPRDSDDGKALYELLRNGGEYTVTVDVSFPNNPDNSIYFRIDKFVCPDWHRHE